MLLPDDLPLSGAATSHSLSLPGTVRPRLLLRSLLGSVLVLGDLDRLLALVVGVTGDVLDEGVDERVLIKRLGADHHVCLCVAILTCHRVGHLNNENEMKTTITIKQANSPFADQVQSVGQCWAQSSSAWARCFSWGWREVLRD